jgi:hypothetical protein
VAVCVFYFCTHMSAKYLEPVGSPRVASYHVHSRNEVGDSAGSLTLPDWNCALTAYKNLPCVVTIDISGLICLVKEESLPKNAVIYHEHASIKMHMVHVNEIRHYIDKFTVN